VALALWGAVLEVAAADGVAAMYVSAVPTGSAVGFCLSRRCGFTEPVHPALYARELDDIHLVCSLP
jgi:hypothetical protein